MCRLKTAFPHSATQRKMTKKRKKSAKDFHINEMFGGGKRTIGANSPALGSKESRRGNGDAKKGPQEFPKKKKERKRQRMVKPGRTIKGVNQFRKPVNAERQKKGKKEKPPKEKGGP